MVVVNSDGGVAGYVRDSSEDLLWPFECRLVMAWIMSSGASFVYMNEET
jgi:hypothetical protein